MDTIKSQKYKDTLKKIGGIETNGLNTPWQSEVFSTNQLYRAIHYLMRLPITVEYIGVREIHKKFGGRGFCEWKLTIREALNFIKNLKPNIDFYFYEYIREDDRKMQGHIEIRNNMDILGELSYKDGIILREAMENPEIIFEANLLDTKGIKRCENRCPYLKEIINYICEKNLVGYTVEFSMFHSPLGVENENIIIWEIRNY